MQFPTPRVINRSALFLALGVVGVLLAVSCKQGNDYLVIGRRDASVGGSAGPIRGSQSGDDAATAVDAWYPDAAADGGKACADDVECDDEDLCTGTERCVNGICQQGVRRTCTDANSCTSDVCVPATGVCEFTAVGDGTPCLDTDLCDGQVCSNGLCVAGAPVICADDGNRCTAQFCDPTLGACAIEELPNGSSCADNDLCNGNEVCGNAGCVPGTPLDCNDNDLCTVDTCNPAAGCEHFPAQDGQACGDADLCNGREQCVAGACVSIAPLSCDDQSACTVDTCNPTTGGCTFVALSNGIPCPDANLCDGGTCSAGLCVASAPVVCANDSDGNPCTANTCDPATGRCSGITRPNGSACPDGNACNGTETCLNGSCTGVGAPPNCDDGNLCTADSCVGSSGCQHVVLNAVPCPDSDRCDGQMCNNGACVQGPPRTCSDNNLCTLDSCVPGTGQCAFAALDNTPCPDSNRCDGQMCITGVCVAGTPFNCNDNNVCTADSCTPSTGLCSFSNLPAVPCPDGNLCDGQICASGVCVAGTPPNCNDNNVCTTDSCTPATGQCGFSPLNAVACQDGNLCDGQICVSGTCTSGTPVACISPQFCDPASGNCRP
jgi:Dictyostelium (slime mold) repeat